MFYAVSVFRMCYLLFLYQVLQDLQETLEFEIFGPSGSMESKSTEADDIESKSNTIHKIYQKSKYLEERLIKSYLLSENSLTLETITVTDTNIDNNEQVK